MILWISIDDHVHIILSIVKYLNLENTTQAPTELLNGIIVFLDNLTDI